MRLAVSARAVVVASFAYFSTFSLKSATGFALAMPKSSLSDMDLGTLKDQLMVPVKNGKVEGDQFLAHELWKDLPDGDSLMIHVVRRPG